MKTIKQNAVFAASIFLFISSAFFCNDLLAQQRTATSLGQIAGNIYNNNKSPVEFASVSLFEEDSTIITGVLSDTSGMYVFNDVNQGNYFLVVRHLEYESFQTPLFSLNSGELRKMQSISMLSGVVELKEVKVVAKVPLFEVQADKIVFNVAASPSASGTNGLDLLRQSPGVTLDMDNNISLLSKGGVQIYINGRPTRLSGNDLSMMLQSLNSDNISNIEIISNPSSKYDAQGNAGIININIKKNLAVGFNGIANANGSKGNFYRSSAGLTLNYGGSKISANARLTQSTADIQDDLFDTKDQNGFFIESRSNEIKSPKSYNLDLGFQATLSEKHSLSFSGTTILNNGKNRLLNNTLIFRGQTDLQEILESKSLLNATSNNLSLNLNHNWKINSSESFSADLSYGNYNTARNTDQPNTFLSPDGERVRSVQNTNFDANTGIDFYSIKADYEKSLKKVKLSTGVKYGLINTNDDFDFFNIPSNGTMVLDETKSNEFTYLEKVLALYGIADVKLNEKYKLNLGLRMENTNSRGQLISTLPINNKDVPRSYTDFFSNVGLSFNDQKVHAWSLSMGRRITRPIYTDLNPFITPLSQLLVREGNPFLRPNYIMNYQFTYTLKQSLTITNSYSVTKDFFASIFEIVGENGNRVIPQNMQHSTSYGISVSYPLQVNKFWNITSFVNGSFNTFEGDLNGTIIDLSARTYNIRVQNNIKLPKGFNMDLSYYRFSDLIWRGSILIQGNQGVNFGLRKEFFERKLQINVTGSDIFRTDSDYFYSGNYGGIVTDGIRTFDNRRYGISAALKFGNQKVKIRTKNPSSLDEEMKRLQGSN
jgi:iron complex outermembrane recepter protein